MQVCIIHTKTREVNNLPNIKSAKKRVKVIEKKTLQNQMFKTNFKTTLKKFEKAVEAGDKAQAAEAFKKAEKKLMQAAAKGTFHKNTVARKISRFERKLNALDAK
jgi:small subunit ribosomal protein S20